LHDGTILFSIQTDLFGNHSVADNLAGTLPPEISKLEALPIHSLSDNQLKGTIPSKLGNLGELTWLTLSSNQLMGTVPSLLGNLGELTHLYLQGNQLTGTIPSELGNRADYSMDDKQSANGHNPIRARQFGRA
jgi:Leucine-rich repeat (LRR) protein